MFSSMADEFVCGTCVGTTELLAVEFTRAAGTELKFGAVTVAAGRVAWFGGIAE
jgi:hypothetical protein